MKMKLLHQLSIVAIVVSCATFTVNAFAGTIVSSKTLWHVDNIVTNNTELSSGPTPTEQSGLYLRGATGSHAVKAYAEQTNLTIYGYTLNLSNVYSIPGNSSLTSTSVSSLDAGADVNTTSNDRCIALNVGVPGHLILCMKPSSTTTAGRAVNIFFNGVDKLNKLITDWTVQSGTTTAVYEIINIENTTAGTYYIGSIQSTRIAAIVFVPTSEYNASLANESGITTGVNIPNADKDTDGKMYNIYGQEVDSNYKGIYILNGKKYIRK